ncbi:DNAJ heat shock N-terminal domain-containing protein-like [Oryza sativa Japonica Group]|uniref:DNAJ heat shock N-terminal domain-containing protein-like n=1 Tax=Oryza sativa subsp. japonica TaxID=39947 RepID=Q5QMD1_ORYSJ|nr:DNAJ heat shock N-terminal domain-containing protein-like [Oryza sativa Japonica Group]
MVDGTEVGAALPVVRRRRIWPPRGPVVADLASPRPGGGGSGLPEARRRYLIRSLYNKAKEIADADDEKSKTSDASLVDKYNSSKRSVSLVQKHKESKKEKKKRSRSNERKKKGKGTINHPWKPCDREKDLTAGRQNVNLDPENMAQGLSSRFSSGAVQRNFKDDHVG